MEIQFCTFLGINITLIVILLVRTRARVFRIFAGSALNPLMVFCLLAIIFNIDFCVVWSNPYIDFTEYVPSIPPTTVVEAYGIYTVLFSATFLGLTSAIAWWSRFPIASIYPPSRPDVAAQRSAKAISLILCVVVLFNLPVYLSYNLSEYAYVVFGREHIWLTLITWLVPPTVAIFVAHHRPALSIAFCGMAVSFMYVAGGGRGFVLLVISALAISYSTYKRISSLWFAVFFPVLGIFLAFFRYESREIGRYANYSAFINERGGYLALFFGGEEVSFAKMFAMTYQIAPQLPTGMFDGFAALITLPFPRQFFPEKLLGASAYFTQYISPTRWDLTQSESLVTGFGDIYWHFGFAAVPILFAIAFGWLWLCVHVINTSRESTIMCLPLLNFGMYTFMRGDVFNVGLVLWPALIMIGAYKVFEAFFRLVSGAGITSSPFRASS